MVLPLQLLLLPIHHLFLEVRLRAGGEPLLLMIRVLQFRFQTFFLPSALFPHHITLYFFNEMVHRAHNYNEQYHSSVRPKFILGIDCVLGVSPLEEPGLSCQCSCLSFSTDETSQQQLSSAFIYLHREQLSCLQRVQQSL